LFDNLHAESSNLDLEQLLCATGIYVGKKMGSDYDRQKGRFRLKVGPGAALIAIVALGASMRAQVTQVSAMRTTASETAAGSGGSNGGGSGVSAVVARKYKKPDRNRGVYYRNKLEASFETGWLPINIPFVFDFVTGDPYQRMSKINYTLVPNMVSLRWQLDDVGSPWILRGNWEASFSAAATIIPRGAETRYFAYDMGIRRYFVQRNWRVVPYTEGRLGMGNINAMGPRGVVGAQGQNFTFTVMLGSGLRFNLTQRYSMWAGVGYMHVSNLFLSEPRYHDYGINVYGPMAGIAMTLGRKEHVAR
jgi:hypothetical protein